MPTIVNLRQDPFERTPSIRGESLNNMGGGYMNDFYAREFGASSDEQATDYVSSTVCRASLTNLRTACMSRRLFSE
jgi:hypothetical protein